MITTIEKDLTSIKSGIIGHQVNCLGLMGAGVAKLLADLYPDLLHQYRIKCHTHALYLSRCLIWQQDDLIILNLAGQILPGGPNEMESQSTRLEALEKALLHALSQLPPNPTIYLPYNIGCGYAGGNWSLTYNMLENLQNVNITLCKLP